MPKSKILCLSFIVFLKPPEFLLSCCSSLQAIKFDVVFQFNEYILNSYTFSSPKVLMRRLNSFRPNKDPIKPLPSVLSQWIPASIVSALQKFHPNHISVAWLQKYQSLLIVNIIGILSLPKAIRTAFCLSRKPVYLDRPYFVILRLLIIHCMSFCISNSSPRIEVQLLALVFLRSSFPCPSAKIEHDSCSSYEQPF